MLTLPAGPDGADVTFPDFLRADLDSVYKEYAGFGSVTWYVSPRFDITAGARYSHNTQRTRQSLDGSYLFFVGSPVIPDVVNGKSSENVFTWSIAPRFELSDNTTLYARVAKGYRPGGPNVVPPNSPPDYPSKYNADTLISYEAGVRAETSDRSFAIDASVYYLDWRDIQVLVTYDTSIGPVSADGNGDSASSAGAEITATMRPVRGLDVVLNRCRITTPSSTRTCRPATVAMTGTGCRTPRRGLPICPPIMNGRSAMRRLLSAGISACSATSSAVSTTPIGPTSDGA